MSTFTKVPGQPAYLPNFHIFKCSTGYMLERGNWSTGTPIQHAFSTASEMLEWLTKELSDEAQS